MKDKGNTLFITNQQIYLFFLTYDFAKQYQPGIRAGITSNKNGGR